MFFRNTRRKQNTLNLKKSIKRLRACDQVWGFTVLEILITIGVTAILATYLITFTHSGRDQVALYVDQSKITQVILRAKTLTLATYTSPRPVCGYGVHFFEGTNRYSIFGYSTSVDAATCRDIVQIDPVSPSWGTIANGTLSEGIVYGGGPQAVSDVFFVPPDPRTLMSFAPLGPLASSTIGYVYLQTRDGQSNLRITINAVGQVGY